jgi:hypothetical protein
MRPAHKPKIPDGPHDVKAGLIRKHGTIAEYIRASGRRPGTVYAAIKGRRNGPIARAIRREALA